MKHRIYLLVFAVSFFGITEGTANNRKANRYFELYKYSKAIPLYKKTTLQGNDEDIREAIFRLADCYRLINDVKEARSWYSKSVELYDPEPVHYYYLGQALRSLEEYDEAEKAFLKYAELEPEDKRGEIYARYCRDIQQMEELDESVEIKNASSLNSKFYDFAPIFYKDGVLFTSDRSSGLPGENVYEWTNYAYLDLYFSEPSYFRDFWTQMSEPKRMSDIFNQTWHDGPVSFSSDFKTLFLTRTTKSKVKRDKNNYRTSLLKIYIGEISENKRTNYTPFPYNNETYSVGHPTVSGNGTKLIFSSDMFGGFGGSDLYISERIGGNWSKPQNLGPEVNTFGNEVFPFWYNDSVLYFSSDGHLGFGGLDIFESRWNGEKWLIPENMRKPVNSPYDDFGLAFHTKKNDGFFSSNRPGGSGGDDIYAIRNYTRKPVKEIKEEGPETGKWPATAFKACGYVKDKETMLPLENATVFVMNLLTRDVLVLKTDSSGFYCVPVEKEILYVAKAMMPKYFDDCLNFRFNTLDSATGHSVPRDLLLDKYEVNKIFAVQNIYYDLDKWYIRDDAKPALDNIIHLMKQYPINIELSSHTDSRASREYNDLLSQKRAEAAVRYITLKGVNPVRMVAQGYGETMLVNHCSDGVNCTEAQHQSNRRTEFKIIDTESDDFEKEPFDPTIFRDGENIPVQLLSPDFFRGCLISSPQQDIPSSGIASFPVIPEIPESIVYDSDKNEEQSLSGIHTDNGTFFTVQVLANIIPLDVTSSKFGGEPAVFEKKVGEYYKYYIGQFGNYNDARAKRRQLVSRFPGCFVVAFHEGIVVPVNELKAVLK